jgi:hypothetical protein
MLASTAKLWPRNFLIVLALAGDSTITRLVVPLVAVVPPFRAAVDERAEADLAAVVRLPVLELERVDVLLPEVVLPPVGFLVVAIYFFTS